MDKKEIEQQTEHIFNVCEKPIMQFISKLLNTDNIFTDKIPLFVEPLIIPIEEIDKVAIFTLKISDCEVDNKRIDSINDIIKYNDVRESIGFLYYAIKNVYAPIVSQSMTDNTKMINIRLFLDESKWIFTPRFLTELSLKISFLEQSLLNLDSIGNDENKTLIDEEKENVIKVLEIVKKEYEENELDIKEKENNKTNEYKDYISIVVELIEKENVKQYIKDMIDKSNIE